MKNLFVLFCMSMFTSLSWSQQETSVLFIGNSFTFMNDMPTMFRQIAEAKGHKIYVDTVVEGGKNFEYHASQKETYATIRSRKWDYVIIQGHSNELAQPDSKVEKQTLPFAKQIVDSIRANNPCTQVVLYMTWGYKYGNPKWAPISSYDSMQFRVKNQYMRFADFLNARVSPVGEVWKTVRSNYSGLNLYDPDNQHPSLAGSYISACTHFATIFGESPIGNGIQVKLSPEERQIIEWNASQIVLNNLNQWRFIPKNKKIIPGFDVTINGKKVQIDSRAQHAAFVEWDLGDGMKIVGNQIEHEYKEKGSYTIRQIVREGCDEVVYERKVNL